MGNEAVDVDLGQQVDQVEALGRVKGDALVEELLDDLVGHLLAGGLQDVVRVSLQEPDGAARVHRVRDLRQEVLRQLKQVRHFLADDLNLLVELARVSGRALEDALSSLSTWKSPSVKSASSL